MTEESNEKPKAWVVVIGSLIDGYDIFGPFETWDDASEWADPMMDIAGFFPLERPEEAKFIALKNSLRFPTEKRSMEKP